MSPKDSFWIGAKGGLLDQKHIQKMRMAVWMFMYLLRNQTGLNVGGEGIVSYGHPLTLSTISDDFKGTPQGTIRRWIVRLRRAGYIRTEEHSNRGLTFWIAKAKSKTKVPRIQHEVTPKVAKNSRAKMNGRLENSRPELSGNQHSSRDNLNGSFSQTISQFNESQGIGAFSETPTPKGFTSKNPLYYNNASIPVLSLLGKEKSIPPEKPTPSAMQIEARRRMLLRQAEQLAKKYSSKKAAAV